MQQEVTYILNFMSKHCQSALHAPCFSLMHAVWCVITCWFEVHRHNERIYEKDVSSCVLSAVDWLAGPAPVCQGNEVKMRGHPGSALHHLRGPKKGSSPTCIWLAAKPKENTCWWGWGDGGLGRPPPPPALHGEMWGPGQSQRTNTAKQLLNTASFLKTRLIIDLAAGKQRASSVLKSSELP